MKNIKKWKKKTILKYKNSSQTIYKLNKISTLKNYVKEKFMISLFFNININIMILYKTTQTYLIVLLKTNVSGWPEQHLKTWKFCYRNTFTNQGNVKVSTGGKGVCNTNFEKNSPYSVTDESWQEYQYCTIFLVDLKNVYYYHNLCIKMSLKWSWNNNWQPSIFLNTFFNSFSQISFSCMQFSSRKFSVFHDFLSYNGMDGK